MAIFKSKEKRTKTKEIRKDNQEFIELAKDLKEIVLSHNQRISEVESLVKRIAQRMGL